MYVRTGGLSGFGLGDAASAAVGGAISAGVSLATSATSLWLSSIQLSHEADTATTQIVNGLEPLLRANLAAYRAGPGTCADQAAAIAAFLSAYQWLISVKGCGNGAYGSAGNACISDRFGPGGATDTSGTKWPWAAYYYLPIVNDPRASGCAAQLAADNPNAAEQSAIQNLANLTSGSTAQTTAGLYDTGSSSGTTVLPAALTQTAGGIPLWGWLAGGLVAFLLLK